MIVAIGSWRGVGATTLALLLASHFAEGDPQGAWLIEADPAGGVLAARMQLQGHSIGGLERIAFPTERSTPPDAFAATAHQAGNLRIVTSPADPFRSFACHQPRMPWSTSLRELSGHIVVDVGRLRAGSPVWSVLGVADHVLVVAAPEVAAAVTTAEWLKAAGRVSHNDPGLVDANARVVVVDMPSGVAFTESVLRADMKDDLAGWLPWEPSAVDLIHRGAAVHDRRLRRSNLVSAVARVADELTRETVS